MEKYNISMRRLSIEHYNYEKILENHSIDTRSLLFRKKQNLNCLALQLIVIGETFFPLFVEEIYCPLFDYKKKW